jgi:hypothetical protein
MGNVSCRHFVRDYHCVASDLVSPATEPNVSSDAQEELHREFSLLAYNVVSPFKVNRHFDGTFLLHFQGRRWKRHVSRSTPNRLHGVISQKT